MRYMVAALVLSGCVATAPSAESIPEPQLPADGASFTGPQAQSVFSWCYANARREQPGASLRAIAYHKSYVRTCMLQFNVPPEYVFVLMQNI